MADLPLRGDPPSAIPTAPPRWEGVEHRSTRTHPRRSGLCGIRRAHLGGHPVRRRRSPRRRSRPGRPAGAPLPLRRRRHARPRRSDPARRRGRAARPDRPQSALRTLRAAAPRRVVRVGARRGRRAARRAAGPPRGRLGRGRSAWATTRQEPPGRRGRAEQARARRRRRAGAGEASSAGPTAAAQRKGRPRVTTRRRSRDTGKSLMVDRSRSDHRSSGRRPQRGRPDAGPCGPRTPVRGRQMRPLVRQGPGHRRDHAGQRLRQRGASQRRFQWQCLSRGRRPLRRLRQLGHKLGPGPSRGRLPSETVCQCP